MTLFVDFELYVADSESSSIRVLSLRTKGTRLLAGGDPIFPDNLFKVILFLIKKPLVFWTYI